MADESSSAGPSSSYSTTESLESTVEVNVKTLDSQIYTFRVNKNVPVSSFKEKIASAVNVPVGQQRLIFRGKVLKDDHLLSEYHLEDGHTLHLVARQPSQSETPAGTSSGEAGGNHENRGNDSAPSGPRNRIGQISHSVVLGTFNIGDQGEGTVPDLTRIIGAVLNSVGVGNVATGGASSLSMTTANAASSTSQGLGRGASQGNNGGTSQTGNQAPPGPGFLNVPFQSLQQSLQFPFPGVLALPPLQAIPDSLTTLSEFINRMEQALSDNGYQPSQTVNVGNPPMPESASSNAHGLPTPEGLCAVMRRAQQLLNGPAGSALSSIAGRIEREGSTSDLATRGQIQSQAMQIGVAMQHLGALLLELGRTMIMLRMGQSPSESVVNAGPAVYISSSGPNPIMVQPFPSQASSLFGTSGSAQANTGIPSPIGTGDVPRNISIHIHAGTAVAPGLSSVGSRASTGEAVRGQNPNQTQATVNGTGLVNSGPMGVLPVRNVVGAIPGQLPSDAAGHVLSVFYPVNARSQQMNPNLTTSSQGPSPAVSNGMQLGLGSSISQPTAPSVSPPSAIAQLQMHVRDVDSSRQGENASQTTPMINVGEGPQVPSGSSTSSSIVSEGTPPSDDREINETGQGRMEDLQMEDSMVSSSMTQTSSVSLQGDFPKTVSHASSSGTCANAIFPGSTPSSSQSQEPTDGGETVPLGLGFGGLQPKRRSKQVKVRGKDGGPVFGTPVNQNQQSIARGQQFLQALASRGSSDTNGRQHPDANDPPMQLPPVFHQIMESLPLGIQDGNRQNDAASLMSQLVRSPALDSLLEGMSQQTGIGSSASLRNIMEQITQSPSVINTLNQIALDVDKQDPGNIHSGSGRGRGGIDFSRMLQQLMPAVSQALSQGATHHAPSRTVEPEPPCQHDEDKPSSNGVDASTTQIDLHQAVERIESHDSPANLFHTVVRNAGHLYGEGNVPEDLVEEICSNSTLANEFMEMLQRDIQQRLQSESSSPGDKS